jgi:hypothetical protein
MSRYSGIRFLEFFMAFLGQLLLFDIDESNLSAFYESQEHN